MGVSIKDVAKAAGVSTATVSRIINNSPLISPSTRKKTLKVMKELNYVPNSMARALSNKKPFNVTLLIDVKDMKSYSNPFFYEVVHGIETAVYKKGLCLTIASARDPDKKHDILDWHINGKRVQGLIIPASLADEKIIARLEKIEFPFVVIGEPSEYDERLSWVDIDNRQGGRQAVEHLLEKGYRKIAFIGGSVDERFNKSRLLGVKDALLESGMLHSERYIKECNGSKQDAYLKMRELIDMRERPDAVIGGDNIICFGAMKALAEAGLAIPGDTGVLSFNDYPLAELTEPPLTSVVIDVFELGVRAAEMLLDMMDDPGAERRQGYIPTRIKARESTNRAIV